MIWISNNYKLWNNRFWNNDFPSFNFILTSNKKDLESIEISLFLQGLLKGYSKIYSKVGSIDFISSIINIFSSIQVYVSIPFSKKIELFFSKKWFDFILMKLL